MFSNIMLDVQRNKKLLFVSCVIIVFLFFRSWSHEKVFVQDFAMPFDSDVVKVAETEAYVGDVQEFQVEIVKGDSLVDILHHHGVNSKDIYDLLLSLKGKYNPQKIYKGQLIDLAIEYGEEKRLVSFDIRVDNKHKLISVRNDRGCFESRLVEMFTHKKLVKVSGVITGSLFVTAKNYGMSDQLVMNLARLYSRKINFNRDVQDGDKFEVIFEQFLNRSGDIIYDGDIIYASFIYKKKQIDLYRYTVGDGRQNYFYGNGEYASTNGSLFSYPLREIKVSSNFGKRYHPIHKKMIFHKGVDLVADIGTPVSSAGSGVVEYLGNRGGYGKYIKIKHDKNYSTAYAHLSKFAQDIEVGSIVRAGQVIAYSGKTGNVTGPHLHYEVLYDDEQVDPMKLDSYAVTSSLEGKEFVDFKRFVSKLHEDLINIERLDSL